MVAFNFPGFLVYLFLSFLHLFFGGLLLVDSRVVVIRSLIELLLHLVEFIERLLRFSLFFGGSRFCQSNRSRHGKTRNKNHGHCSRSKCSLMFCDRNTHREFPPGGVVVRLSDSWISLTSKRFAPQRHRAVFKVSMRNIHK